MNSLAPKLQMKVAQKQILTPGLVQMVTLLQLNGLELRDMISQEMAQNPFLEEGPDGEDLTPQEVQTLIENERQSQPADSSILETVHAAAQPEGFEAATDFDLDAAIGARFYF